MLKSLDLALLVKVSLDDLGCINQSPM